MDCLVAVGSNLGSRQAIVRSALAEAVRLVPGLPLPVLLALLFLVFVQIAMSA